MSDDSNRVATANNWYITKRNSSSTWNGYIGLMYPSDYGFATNDGNSRNRKTCLQMFMYNWYHNDCKNKDYLYKYGESGFTTSLRTNLNSQVYVNYFSHKEMIPEMVSYKKVAIILVFYLKNEVQITSGTGTRNNLFQLSI